MSTIGALGASSVSDDRAPIDAEEEESMTVFELRVDGLPPAKSQCSVFGVRSSHHDRALTLLKEARRVKSALGFRGVR